MSPQSLRSIAWGVIAALGWLFVAAANGAAAAPATRVPRPYPADPFPSTYRPAPSTAVLIRGATVLDGLGHRFDDADLLLQNGKVVALGKRLAAPAGARVIDAQGRWVTPGIIDVHSHDGDFALPLTSDNTDTNESTDWNTANVWAEHSVQPMDPAFSRALASGVTALQVLPGSINLFGGRGVVLKPIGAVTMQAMKFPGAPYSLKMACGENPKFFYGGKGRFPATRMGNVAGYREAWLAARRYKADWDKYERSGGDPPKRDLKLDTLVGVLDGDIRVHMHCYKADEMAVVLDVAKEMGYRIAAFHHATDAYKIPVLLREAGACVAVWADWWGFKVEAEDGIPENAALLDAAGVCVMMHSDSPALGQRLNIEAGKAAAAGRRAGLDIPPERAIRWVTSNPARALGLADRIGALEPGKNADVVIWSADPLSVYSHADQVFIDGALLYDRARPAADPSSDFELGRAVSEVPQ
jgi:imidazolonepropionase-like amidohydrolase